MIFGKYGRYIKNLPSGGTMTMITMTMIIFIHKKDTLQIMVPNKQQSPNLRVPVESYKKLI